MDEDYLSQIDRIARENGYKLAHPWSWPGPRVRAVARVVTELLDQVPAIGVDDDSGRLGLWMRGAWGHRLGLWRLWEEVPMLVRRRLR